MAVSRGTDLIRKLATVSLANSGRFGALSASNGAANVATIQAALDYINTAGGGTLLIPGGTWPLTGALTIYKKTRLRGVGKFLTKLLWDHTGDGINSTWTVDASTVVEVTLEDIWLANSNAANVGGGFVDFGGSFVTLRDVQFSGWQYQGILDQTEHALVQRCYFGETLLVGLWLVDGPDHTPGASRGYTNRINVIDNHFAQAAGTGVAIVDDGGVSHTLADNNFSGFATHIRSSANRALRVSGGEFETSSSTPIVFAATRFGGTATDASSSPSIEGTLIIAATGVNCVKFFSSGGGANILNNDFTSDVAAVAGVASIADIVALNNKQQSSGGMLDADATHSTVVFDASTQQVSQPAWTGVTYLNSWVDYSASYHGVAYYKDEKGWVHLRGLCKNGSGTGTAVFTLPAGYRPSKGLIFPVASNSLFGYVDVATSGAVTANGSTVWFSMDGISFPTV